jgi:hypothetical protein
VAEANLYSQRRFAKPQEKTRRGKNTKSARAIVPGVFSGRRSKDFRKHHTKEKKPCH